MEAEMRSQSQREIKKANWEGDEDQRTIGEEDQRTIGRERKTNSRER